MSTTQTLNEKHTISLYKRLPRKRLKAREEFARALGTHYYNPIAQKLVRACKTHHRYCEFECNGCTREKHPLESYAEYDKARTHQMEWLELRMNALEKHIAKLAHQLNVLVVFQGDPRGCTCKFTTAKQHTYDEWGHINDHGYIGACPWAW